MTEAAHIVGSAYVNHIFVLTLRSAWRLEPAQKRTVAYSLSCGLYQRIVKGVRG